MKKESVKEPVPSFGKTAHDTMVNGKKVTLMAPGSIEIKKEILLSVIGSVDSE